MLGSAKTNLPLLTLTSWVKGTSPFLFWAWSQNFRSTGLHFQLTNKSTMMIGRAALLTGYHPHILGLQRAGVGRLVLWSIYLSSDLENTFYRFHPYGLNTNVKWVSKLSHPSEIACFHSVAKGTIGLGLSAAFTKAKTKMRTKISDYQTF